ncbi:MAG: DUF6786 family protein [Acidobacteriota bacterium]
MRDSLFNTLVDAGQSPIALEGVCGGIATLLPKLGRVLALFPGESQNSLIWVNPRLYAAAGASELIEEAGWKNFGGDRTWLGPERDIFVRDLADPWNTYEVPSGIDPGNYGLEWAGNSVKMRNSFSVVNHRLRRECSFQLTKQIIMIPNPLPQESMGAEIQAVKYIGYDQRTRLTLTSLEPAFQVDVWNLIQVPSGGEAIIPTLSETWPRDHFEPTGESHLLVDADGVWFKIDAKERHKISITAAASTGRVGYLRRLAGDTWSLIVRNITVNPSGPYIDVPWDSNDEAGYAIQCYNDDGTLGDFGELEYHSTALDTNQARELADCSQVWAFEGPAECIKSVGKSLLGVKLNERAR